MKGLLFTPEMARAVLAGRKTQTRRIVPGVLKCYEEGWSLNGRAPRPCDVDWCAYQAGETVCLLTTWAVDPCHDLRKPKSLKVESVFGHFWHAGLTKRKPLASLLPWGKSRPGRFLPNALRGLMPQLRILDVDVQRVRDISEADARAEGVEEVHPGGWRHYDGCDRVTVVCPSARRSFRSLWNLINARRGYSWQRNPRVFAIKFELLGQ